MSASRGEFDHLGLGTKDLVADQPDSFMRIRHYGFMANGNRKRKIAVIRKLLGANQFANAAKLRRSTAY